jgi:transcriptional regulator with XRE-family HTH domain
VSVTNEHPIQVPPTLPKTGEEWGSLRLYWCYKCALERVGQPAERLTRLRKERGFTQVELAQKVGITQVLISAYETDRCAFSVEMAVRFALVLGISLDELLHPRAKKLASRKPSRRVLRRLELIERLPRRKQIALLTTIDAFLQAAESATAS